MTLKHATVADMLLMTGFALLLASFIGLLAFTPEGDLGRVMLTPEGCVSVKLAGGTAESRDGVCVASGRYIRRFSGWTQLTLAPDLTVTLSSRALLMVADDDRVSAPEDTARRRAAFAIFGAGLVAAALCLLLAVLLGRRAKRNGQGISS